MWSALGSSWLPVMFHVKQIRLFTSDPALRPIPRHLLGLPDRQAGAYYTSA